MSSIDEFYDHVRQEVNKSRDICVAVDKHLVYIGLNETACSYLKIKPEDLIGKSAIHAFPEIIASRNHRNMLKALSGEHITGELIESRMGHLLDTTYTPVYNGKEVKAVILNATIHNPG